MPPGELHEGVIRVCLEKAIVFQSAIPEYYRSRTDVDPSTTFRNFSGAYFGTRKIPDLAIVVNDDDHTRIPRIVFEIGISESYSHLEQSAKLWLEGMPGVQQYILIKIYETPAYSSPSVDGINFPAFDQIVPSAFQSKSKFGPVVYNDLCWTGTLSSAFMEVWTLDPLTRLATKSGKRIVRHYSHT